MDAGQYASHPRACYTVPANFDRYVREARVAPFEAVTYVACPPAKERDVCYSETTCCVITKNYFS
jgi:hypothetical protein